MRIKSSKIKHCLLFVKVFFRTFILKEKKELQWLPFEVIFHFYFGHFTSYTDKNNIYLVWKWINMICVCACRCLRLFAYIFTINYPPQLNICFLYMHKILCASCHFHPTFVWINFLKLETYSISNVVFSILNWWKVCHQIDVVKWQNWHTSKMQDNISDLHVFKLKA